MSESVWVVAFKGRKGISEMFVFPSKTAAVRAKKHWDREWKDFGRMAELHLALKATRAFEGGPVEFVVPDPQMEMEVA